MPKIITTYLYLISEALPLSGEVFAGWSERILALFLYALSEFLPFTLAAFLMSICACFLRTPHATLFTIAGALAGVIAYGLFQQYRYNITPGLRIKKYWLRPTEVCVYELAIGSAALVFASAILTLNVFATAFFILTLWLLLAAFWNSRGVFDISVLL